VPCSSTSALHLKSYLDQSARSELILDYLDDVEMGDTTSIMLSDFISLEDAASQLGLEIKRSKCEVVGHTTESRMLFEE